MDFLPPPSLELIKQGFSSTVVPPTGDGSSGIMVIGEAPGRHEDEEGIPFHPKADAGSVLARVLRLAGVERHTLTLTNVCWQRPPMNELDGCPYEWDAQKYWLPYNYELIRERQPKVIILMGNVPLRTFSEFGNCEKQMITNVANYSMNATIAGHRTILLFSLHPSFILHGQQAFTQTLIWDIQRAVFLAQHGIPPQPTNYLHTPNEYDFLAFERRFSPDQHILSFDIETPESTNLDEEEVDDAEQDISYNIIRASFSFDAIGGYAISVPWQSPFKEIYLRMMAKAQRLEVWNKVFDCPRLKHAGVSFEGKRVYDRMHSFHFLQPTLPRSLGFASAILGWSLPPWKHLSQAQPGIYSAEDAHALRFNGEMIEQALKARGRYELHERHVVQCYEVLEKMAENGLPYDAAAAKEFGDRLEKMKKEREDALQSMVPDEIKPVVQSHRKKGYKKPPKDLVGCVRRFFTVGQKDLTKSEIGDPNVLVMGDKFRVERWCRLEAFNPNSSPQLIALIHWHKHKLGKDRKTKKESANDENLRKLIKKCIETNGKSRPQIERDTKFVGVLKMCRECKQLGKVIGTYVKGWVPGKDERVHGTPKFSGKMFRISWKNPNTSAVIADKTEDYIASGFRKCVRAADGRVLVESDWKGIEAVLVGHFAGDYDYLRLAKIGVHDYFCCHLLVDRGKLLPSDVPDLSLPDKDLKAALKFIKKTFPKDRDDAKHTVHGPLTPDHEVLTSKGWVKIDRYDQKTPLAQWWEDGRITFAPAGLVSRYFEGELVGLEGRSISLRATPDHRVPVKSYHYPTGKSYLKETKAGDLSKFGRLPTTGVLEGGIHWDENAIRLLVAIQADGHICPDGSVRFNLRKKRKIERLKEIAKGREYSIRGEGQRYRFSALSVWDVTKYLIGKSKTFDLAWLLRLDKDSRKVFLDELKYWDGERSEGKAGRQTSYMTCNKTNADIVQAIAHISGRQGLLRKLPPSVNSYRKQLMYKVSFNQRTEARLECLERTSPYYKGRVYCISNTQSGWVVVRHNGKVSVTGNSNYGMTAILLSAMYELPYEQAERLLKLYFETFPKIKQWQDRIKEHAARYVWLENIWGYRMPFWDIYRWDSQRYERLTKIWGKSQPGASDAAGMPHRLSDNEKQWLEAIRLVQQKKGMSLEEAISNLSWNVGDDAKSAISFIPRDTAAGMLRETLLKLRWMAEDKTMLLSTHDSILGETERSKLDWLAYTLRDTMEEPWPMLTAPQYPDGLVIGAEVKWGQNWDSADSEDESSMKVYEFST